MGQVNISAFQYIGFGTAFEGATDEMADLPVIGLSLPNMKQESNGNTSRYPAGRSPGTTGHYKNQQEQELSWLPLIWRGSNIAVSAS